MIWSLRKWTLRVKAATSLWNYSSPRRGQAETRGRWRHFLQKQPCSGSQSEGGLTRSAALQSRLNALKTSPYLVFLGWVAEYCVSRDKTARPSLLRVRRLFISPPSVPGSLRTSSSASRCLCAPRGASQRITSLCAKVHPLRPISAGSIHTLMRHCEKIKDETSYD